MRATPNKQLITINAVLEEGAMVVIGPLVVASGVAVVILVVGLLTVLPVVDLVVVSVAIIVVVCNGTSRRSIFRNNSA